MEHVQAAVTGLVALALMATAWNVKPFRARWLMVPVALALASALFSVYVVAVTSRKRDKRLSIAHRITAALSVLLLVVAVGVLLIPKPVSARSLERAAQVAEVLESHSEGDQSYPLGDFLKQHNLSKLNQTPRKPSTVKRARRRSA